METEKQGNGLCVHNISTKELEIMAIFSVFLSPLLFTAPHHGTKEDAERRKLNFSNPKGRNSI